MRKILFRGKRKNNGEWVHGDLEHLSYGIITIQGCIVDPETVGQYTGLTDKNGVKIFEGDIVELNYAGVGKINSIISWVETEGAFTAASIKSFPCIFVRLDELPKDVKIAGNIHDNPEMLMEGE
jgi:uncharacterized phage protein (TIGR01671 family)